MPPSRGAWPETSAPPCGAHRACRCSASAAGAGAYIDAVNPPTRFRFARGASLLALLLAACASTPQQRIAEQRSAFDAYPPAVQQQIRQGQVAVGFTPEMVRLAMGKPDSVETRTSGSGTSEVWIYRDHSPLLGFSLGFGSFGGGFGSGVGVGTSTGGRGAERSRVTFEQGRVTHVEQTVK